MAAVIAIAAVAFFAAVIVNTVFNKAENTFVTDGSGVETVNTNRGECLDNKVEITFVTEGSSVETVSMKRGGNS